MSIAMKMRHKVELNAPLMTVRIPGELQEGDADANAFVLELYRDHEPFEPDGETVTGYLTRADGNSVLLDGTADKNIITVTLSQACYRVPGFFSAFIRLTNTEGEKRTIFKAAGMMSEDKQGGIVDDEHVVPTLDDIIAQMEAVERATETANAAAQQAVQTANAASVEAVRIANEAAQNAAQTANNAAETANEAAENAAEAASEIDKKVEKATAGITAAVDALQKVKAPAIECDATGSIVTITDGAAMPVVELISHIEPVQAGSGEPSPDNVRPISGWNNVNAFHTGENMIPYPYMSSFDEKGGVVYSDNGNGTVVANGTSNDNIAFNFGEATLQAGIYRLSGCPNGGGASIYRLQANKTGASGDSTIGFDTGSGLVFSLSEVTTIKIYFIVLRGSVIDNKIISPMLVSGSDARAYTAPLGYKTLTADLPETVYGGTLDWTNGKCVVALGFVTLTGEGVYKHGVASNGKLNVDITLKKHAMSENYEPGICSDRYLIHHFTAPTKDAIRVMGSTICIYDDRFTDIETAKAILNEEKPQVVYKLNAPYTIQLTPQQLDMLKGTNNLWSDCGDTTLVYVADTKMYIDNLFGSLAAAVINN